MSDMAVKFDCPVCGVNIPIPQATTPTAQGLTVTWDDTYAMEHAIMHADCLCGWAPGEGKTAHIVEVDAGCRFHGSHS